MGIVKETFAEKSPAAGWLWLFWLVPIFGAGYFVVSLSDQDLLVDWLGKDGGHVLVWWFLTTLAGIGVLPLLFRLLPGLADRGYTLARSAGLMLSAFTFWLLVSLGFLRNEVGAMVLSWLLVLTFSAVLWFRWKERPSRAELKACFADNLPLIVISEVLFAIAFLGWAVIRAHNPELTSTEKPMEMMFINSVRNSLTFPPEDAWLADFAISYYYFGYVITAALADLSNIPTGLAFNLMNALLFALTAVTAFGVTYNLIRARGAKGSWRSGSRTGALGAGLLAGTMLVLMGNLGTALVERPYRGYDTPIPPDWVDADYFEFWDVQDRTTGWRETPPDFETEGWGGWWFRHSRLITDRHLNGKLLEKDPPLGVGLGAQPISEFPQFSFILADNHPHVLSMPFVTLAIGLVAGLALRKKALAGWEMVVYAIFIGGLVFMNSWDAVFIVLAIGGEALRRLMINGNGRLTAGIETLGKILAWEHQPRRNFYLAPLVFAALLALMLISAPLALNTPIYILLALLLTLPLTLLTHWALEDHDWGGIIRFGVVLGVLSYLLYFLWIISFTSQVQGIIPNISNPTKSQAFFLQFGVFVVIIGAFLLQQIWRGGVRLSILVIVFTFITGLVISFGVPLLSGYVLNRNCPLTQTSSQVEMNQLPEDTRLACDRRRVVFGEFAGGEETTGDVLELIFDRRMTALASHIFIFLTVGIIIARLFARTPPDKLGQAFEKWRPINYSPGTGIALLLLGAGLVLAVIPDIFYVWDGFGIRINTIFKLYFQAWILFSVGGAFAVYSLIAGSLRALEDIRPMLIERPAGIAGSAIFSVITGALIIGGLLYPYYAIQTHYIQDSGRLWVRNQITLCEEQKRQVASEERELIRCPEEDVLALNGEPSLIGATSQDEYDAIQCLARLEPHKSDVVVAEAPGNPYQPHTSRVSMLTGIPTLLGWGGHERQWRGDYFDAALEVGSSNRIALLNQLYTASLWSQKQDVARQLGVDYVFVGIYERTLYGDGEGMRLFDEVLDPVCEYGEIAVYRLSARS